MGIASVLVLVAVEVAQRALMMTARQMLQFLMCVARCIGLTDFVSRFDWFHDSILDVNQFKYICVNDQYCQIVSYMYRDYGNQPTYNSKQECLNACVY